MECITDLSPIDVIAIQNAKLYAKLEELTKLRRATTDPYERKDLDFEKYMLRLKIDKGIEKFLKLYTEKPI